MGEKMSSSSRFLLGFGVLILVIVAISVIIAVIGSNQPVKILPENSPEGTVQRFLTAVRDRDYTKAYDFLAPQAGTDKTNTLDQWVSSTQNSRNSTSSWTASIVKSTVNDDNASVDVVIEVFRPNGPLNDPVSSNNVTFLLQKAGDVWLIQQPIDLWWLY
jgi:hypothetical protein